MAGQIVNGTYTATFLLSDATTQNPLTITNTGVINSLSGDAVDGFPGTAWTITNQGDVFATRTGIGGDGISLPSGGVVTNLAGGTIAANYGAVHIQNAVGTVINYSTISSLINIGVNLAGGGSVTNAAGAVIEGHFVPVVIGGTTGNVLNQGLITSTGFNNNGVDLSGGSLVNAATGTITADFTAVDISGAGSVDNAGTITAHLGWGVILVSGGTVTNEASAHITGVFDGVDIKGAAGVVDNAGIITATSTATFGVGVQLENGGSVSNHASGTITGYAAGVAFSLIGPPSTVTNAGTIVASHGDGVALLLGGALGNVAGAVITGGNRGVYARDGAVTVNNQGKIAGTGGTGIELDFGGNVTNTGTGSITGSTNGIVISQVAGTVVNQGLIEATSTASFGYGVELNKGGFISNAAGATISGNFFGIMLRNAATVINAGTIVAIQPGDNAIQFAGGVANLLVDDPGAVFTGAVIGGYGLPGQPGSTLELASAASHGTITGIGSQFVQFGQIVVDANAYWQMTGTNTVAADATLTNQGTLKLFGASLTDLGALLNNGVINVDPSSLTITNLSGTGSVTIAAGSMLDAMGTVASGQTIGFTGTGGVLLLDDPTNFFGTIDGFGAGATIGLHAGTSISSGTILPGNTLQIITSGNGTIDLQLDPTQDFSGQTVSFSGGSATLSVTCFRSGTRIRTEGGVARVEDLRIGDRVMTVAGSVPTPRPIHWLGRRMIDCRLHPHPSTVWPIVVRAGAFADHVPERDLWLSPDHAVFVDGVLIPVKYLTNGTSVVQVQVDRVVYHHVELVEHTVLLAESLPCESYLDTGDRANFDNGGRMVRLHPDFAERVWEFEGCAPLQIIGPQVDSARRELQRRVGLARWNVVAPATAVDVERIRGRAY